MKVPICELINSLSLLHSFFMSLWQVKEAGVVAHFERAYWVKCTTPLCSSLMQHCSGDETSRWEISEPERTCWLTATLDTLAKARTHRKKELCDDASLLQTLWFHWAEIKMTPGAKIYGTCWLKTDNLLFRKKTVSDLELHKEGKK